MAIDERPRANGLRDRWERNRPVIYALGIGMMLGPLVSSFAGYQVRSSTADSRVHAAVVEQQARFCEERARTASAETGRLDWNRGFELARQWATMPGGGTAGSDVVQACVRRLTA
jgi:hypothetical protein